jgi:uncharacterized protein (DUF2126 family)
MSRARGLVAAIAVLLGLAASAPMGLVANIFDPTVRGRVSPVGQFEHSQSLVASGDKVAVEVDVPFRQTGGGNSRSARRGSTRSTPKTAWSPSTSRSSTWVPP